MTDATHITASPAPSLSPLGQLSGRARPADLRRLPRYAGFFLLGAVAIWGPITGYLTSAPETYTSDLSLILPGAGASASVNLTEIGQASSFASSPYAHTSISPTETYKRLIVADRIVVTAADTVGVTRETFGRPRVELIDQTGLIHVQISGPSPDAAQARGNALLAAFFAELDMLRADELDVRQEGGEGAIHDYRASVAATRTEIERLQRETGLISADQYDYLVERTNALRAEVAAARAGFEERDEAVGALQRALQLPTDLAAATLRLHADSEFSSLIEDMASKSAALAETQGRFGPNHPQVADARAGYLSARSMAQSRAIVLTGLSEATIARLDLSPIGARADLLAQLVEREAERKGLAAELAAMEARLTADEAKVLTLLAPAARLEDLQRDFQVAEAVFASAMARSQSTKADVYASYPLVQVLENPSRPDRPSSPNDTLAIAAGAAASVMFALGLCLAWIRQSVIARLLRRDPA